MTSLSKSEHRIVKKTLKESGLTTAKSDLAEHVASALLTTLQKNTKTKRSIKKIIDNSTSSLPVPSGREEASSEQRTICKERC